MHLSRTTRLLLRAGTALTLVFLLVARRLGAFEAL